MYKTSRRSEEMDGKVSVTDHYVNEGVTWVVGTHVIFTMILCSTNFLLGKI